MTSKRKTLLWVSVLLVLAIAGMSYRRWSQRRPKSPPALAGAVIKGNADTRKESPIADVEVTMGEGGEGQEASRAKSDFSGFFNLKVPPAGLATLHFRHPDYKPVDLVPTPGDYLYVARMEPLHGEVEAAQTDGGISIANPLVRYSTQTTITENIGTGVKTFQVVNAGDVPCNQQYPCSPDGKWKAAIDSASLEAGDGNVFQNARVSCIAGPCPFTRIDFDGFSRTSGNIKVTIRNWSDTTTFLLQAEVFHSQVRDIVRKSYPVIFGRSLNFTLPAGAGGLTIEAEMNGTQIIFPIAPDPVLSWADCKVRVESNQAKDYRCELKAGYRFK